MTQSQLNHAVARLTGEPLHQIQSMGFSFVPAPPPRLPHHLRRCLRRPLRRQQQPDNARSGDLPPSGDDRQA